MSSSIAIQPITIDRLSGISPVAFQSLISATSANGASSLDSPSSSVQLSLLGQLLAAGSLLENSLKASQANASATTPGSVLAEAQDFVTAFNNVQQSIGNVLPFLGTLPDNLLVAQFSQTLNLAATSTTSDSNQNLSRLQAIGISSLVSASTGLAEATTRLSIDQSMLTAAVEANPEGTATLLAQATRPLLQQVALFEAQAASSNGLPSDLSDLGTGVPTNLLQNLSADTVLNTIQLANLDLAAVGLDANTIQSVSTVLDASLSATLAGLSSKDNLAILAEVKSAAVVPTPVAIATPVTPSITTPEIPVSTVPISPTASQNIPLSPTGSNIETLSADQSASEATLALQNMMADSALRSIIFDPAYSALIASSHPTDFTSPMPLTRSRATPFDIPAAILAINRASAINSYQEAANGFVRR